MAGYVARLVTNRETRDGAPCPDYQPGKPPCWIEYLVGENADGPVFSEDKSRALIFPSHGEADARAAEIRQKHPVLEHVYGAACFAGMAEESSREEEVRRRDRRRRSVEPDEEDEGEARQERIDVWRTRADLR